MESLMEINNTNKLPLLTNKHKINKIICLFNWLDTTLKITNSEDDYIKKTDLQKLRSYYNLKNLIKILL